MSGDSTVEIISGSSGTTPTELPPSSGPSAAATSPPVSNKYFPPPKVPPRVAAQTTRPQPGTPEAHAHAAVLREERHKLRRIKREIRAALCEPGFEWDTTTKTVRKLIRLMAREPKNYSMAQLLVAQATLAALKDPDQKKGQMNRETALDLAKMLGAFHTEDPADKMKRLLEEDQQRREAIPTEELIAGAKTNGAR